MELEALTELVSGRHGTIPPIIQPRAMVDLDKITTRIARHRRAIASAAASGTRTKG